MSLSSGAYFGSHSTVSQWARAARAASERLLVWIGPLSSTSTTGLVGRPGCGPKRRSSCSRWAMKSLLRLVGLVWTMSWRVTGSSDPSIATFLACPGAGTRKSAPISPRRGRDRDASAPRSHRRREERCRPLRPAVCAAAGAGPPVPPRFPSGVPSACAEAAASGTFFSQGLGQLRTADAHALARFDLGAKAGDRPVAPVGHRFFQQGGGHAQGGFTLHRRRAG